MLFTAKFASRIVTWPTATWWSEASLMNPRKVETMLCPQTEDFGDRLKGRNILFQCHPHITQLFCPLTNACHSFRFLLLFFIIKHQSFSLQRLLMVIHRSLSDSKSPQVSRTLLSILDVLNNVVVWMVSTRPSTSKSSSSLNNPLVTVPNAPITIGIIVTFIFNFTYSLFCCYEVWSSSRDYVIRVYVKVLQEFMCLIF